MLTADVAVDDYNEIAQDSSRMLAHSQGMFYIVVDFRIKTTAPAVGLNRVPKKTGINYITYHMVPYACFLLHEPEKQKNKKTTTTTRTRTCSYSCKIIA